jgi:hypothetical protein
VRINARWKSWYGEVQLVNNESVIWSYGMLYSLKLLLSILLNAVSNQHNCMLVMYCIFCFEFPFVQHSFYDSETSLVHNWLSPCDAFISLGITKSKMFVIMITFLTSEPIYIIANTTITPPDFILGSVSGVTANAVTEPNGITNN